MTAISEFAQAAAPWLCIGLFVAISCGYMNRKNK